MELEELLANYLLGQERRECLEMDVEQKALFASYYRESTSFQNWKDQDCSAVANDQRLNTLKRYDTQLETPQISRSVFHQHHSIEKPETLGNRLGFKPKERYVLNRNRFGNRNLAYFILLRYCRSLLKELNT